MVRNSLATIICAQQSNNVKEEQGLGILSNKPDYVTNPYPRPGYEINGIYRARVENDQDPLEIGRVQVRIPIMHGIPTDRTKVNSSYIATEDLPWAFVAYMGAGYDQGSMIVPEVGSTVFVGFESADPDQPVVLGGIYGMPSDNNYVLGNFIEGQDTGTFSLSESKYYQPKKTESVPSDTKSSSKNKVLYKSPKGATISIIEADGDETLEIIDHAGQVIKMYSPFTDLANYKNKSKRGQTRADLGDNLNIKDTSNDDHVIEIVGTNGGSMKLVSTVSGKTKLLIDVDSVEYSSAPLVTDSDTVNSHSPAEPDDRVPDDLPDKSTNGTDEGSDKNG